MRKISKEKYVIAAILTIGIFMLGLFLGLIIESKRVNYIEATYVEQNVILESSQLQYDFLNSLQGTESCPAVYKSFYQNLLNLEETRMRLEQYTENAMIDKTSFELLEREYLLSEIRYWLLAKKTKDLCQNDVVTILNFHAPASECANCDNQAFILSYLKKLFKDKLLIFSFNTEYEDEPLISMLEATYNITSYPGLVVEDETFNGFVSKDSLLSSICGQFKEKTNGCEKYQTELA